MSEKIYIFDTTLRDGEQSPGATMNLDEKMQISQLLEEVKPLAIDLNLLSLLEPIQEVLESGNQSMKWINAYSNGQTIPMILQNSIKSMKAEEDQSKKHIVNPDCL